MEHWEEYAVCREVENPDIFYLPEHPLAARAALACCARCPVRKECRDFNDEMEVGLAPGAWTGIWAGELPQGREVRRSREARRAR